MSDPLPLSFSAPIMLGMALLAACVAAGIVVWRRPALSTRGRWFGAAALLLLALGAGEPAWRTPAPQRAVVMVDLSASTRSADYRNRAHLASRISALLGRTPYRTVYFAQEQTDSPPPGERLADLPGDATRFSPPADAAAVVLFSDGQFPLPPKAPATYVVVDPGLESPADAAVVSLNPRNNAVEVALRNAGSPRSLTLSGAVRPWATVPLGASGFVAPLSPGATAIAARLSPGDAWPENDQLIANPPPPTQAERWWVGASPPGGNWRTFQPPELPTDAGAYLQAEVVALQNVAATDLSTLQLQRLGQYVRDLGGALVILGGDRAFAAGSYAGSPLEALSPLASNPPQPATHWLLLADASGSMAEIQDGVSLWRQATDAMLGVLPTLPPDDLLSVGTFAESLTWWTTGASVRQAMALPLPPPGSGPHGPTNLQEALAELAEPTTDGLPRQVLLLTDADARIDNPAALAQRLRRANAHLHLLAIGRGSGLPALQLIAGATGGVVLEQTSPARWSQGLQKLMRAGAPRLLGRDPLAIHFSGELSFHPPIDVNLWNRTWMKGNATPLASGQPQSVPAVAVWNAGEGRVLACAFSPPSALAEQMADLIARPARDPRLRVRWDSAAELRVSIDARTAAAYLDDQHFSLELAPQAEPSSASRSFAVEQVGPGQYALAISAPRAPAIATLRWEGRAVERMAVAGRYPPEFEAIGNNHATLERLATQTGGQILSPAETRPIDFRWPARRVPVTSIFAILGALALGAALVDWKLGAQDR